MRYSAWGRRLILKIESKKSSKQKKLEVSVAQFKKSTYLCSRNSKMVELAQLVRASDCGSEGRGFEPHIPPHNKLLDKIVQGLVFSCYYLKNLVFLLILCS